VGDVTIDVSEVIGEINRLQARGKSIPMAMVAAPFVTAIDDEIQSEGRGRWPGFSDNTFKWHPERRGGKLLQDTGRLANMQVRENNAAEEAIIFSPSNKAGIHVNGATKKNGVKIPRRDPFDIDIGKAESQAAAAIEAFVATE